MFLYHHNISCYLQNIHHNPHLHNYFEKEAFFVVPPDFLGFPDLLGSPDFPDFLGFPVLLELPDSHDFLALYA
jgi:hypothetical protein